ncbi:MAG: thermonuclease family protein [Acidimicrobiia bacterium]
MTVPARRRVLGALLAASACVAVASCTSSDGDRAGFAPTTRTTSTKASTHAAGSLPDGTDATVTSVTDGDTIRVHTDAGADERVRLTGIDTPETKDPRTVVECFGKAASARTASLLPAGTRVRLERDVELRDKFGRRLAYVYRAGDGLFVNKSLVADGYAAPYRYPPNVKYADEFSALGATARENGVGLWGACGGTNTPASASSGSSTVTTTRNTGACDSNYSGACVPITNTDLDCSDIDAKGFRVVGADPHRFDGNHDGIACE